MEFRVQIEASSLTDAINNLADAIRSLGGAGICVGELLEKAVEVHQQEQVQEQAPAPMKLTIDEVRAIMVAAAKRKAPSDIKRVLAEYNSTQLSEVDASKYGELAAKLEAL